MKRVRFQIIYVVSIIISFLLSKCLDNMGLNENLMSYYDFIGDILNFSAILTGFLGAVISILTSISKSSPIITRVLKSKKAFLQLVLSMAIPFGLGFVIIFLSMVYRLKLKNPAFLSNVNNLNIWLGGLTIYFVITSILMTVIIFYIFFLDGSSNEVNKKSKKRKVRFKEN